MLRTIRLTSHIGTYGCPNQNILWIISDHWKVNLTEWNIELTALGYNLVYSLIPVENQVTRYSCCWYRVAIQALTAVLISENWFIAKRHMHFVHWHELAIRKFDSTKGSSIWVNMIRNIYLFGCLILVPLST